MSEKDAFGVEVASDDAEFESIRSEEILEKIEFFSDVYIRLSAGHYVKLLRAGDQLTPERIEGYRKKGVTHYYVKKGALEKIQRESALRGRAAKFLTEHWDKLGVSADSEALLKRTVELAFLEKEIEISSAVKKAIASKHVYDDKFVQLRSHNQSASQCGGDWCGFFVARDQLIFSVADATGHGIEAALVVTAAHSAFSVIQNLIRENPDFPISPSQFLSLVNASVFNASHGDTMMTCFIGAIDFKRRVLTYVNAGHNPPWLFSVSGETIRPTSLLSGGPRLGEQANLPKIPERRIPVTAKDTLFFYTDGLTEGRSTEGASFGKKRVRHIVESSLSGGPDIIVSGLMSEFIEFNQGKSLDDDVTFGAAKILDLPSFERALS